MAEYSQYTVSLKLWIVSYYSKAQILYEDITVWFGLNHVLCEESRGGF